MRAIRKKEEIVACAQCGFEFISRIKTQKFCSSECYKKNYRARYRTENEADCITRGTRGALSELLVCADLLKRGYHVFRAVSPNCTCDLAIMIGEKLYRVEVKTVADSSYNSGAIPLSILKDKHKFDIYAGVCRDGRIYYVPDLNNIMS